MKTRYFVINNLYPSTGLYNITPLLCICGNWLDEAGFIPGQEVSVEVRKHGELIIKLLT